MRGILCSRIQPFYYWPLLDMLVCLAVSYVDYYKEFICPWQSDQEMRPFPSIKKYGWHLKLIISLNFVKFMWWDHFLKFNLVAWDAPKLSDDLCLNFQQVYEKHLCIDLLWLMSSICQFVMLLIPPPQSVRK